MQRDHRDYDSAISSHSKFSSTLDELNLVESIVLSIISMLSSPNDESPANVEAAKEWRERRSEFRKKVSRCVRKSQEML
ncbi:Ubiquitin-conjugating enzyme E2 14 [Morus notabilis]|uniref:Ubiquitin-conjugating enzyme E2 14 n=1 Tax=Morus notabilis TaxID=981085 RepID=W9R600_9ROSA|nr:Ubiquitin-conjugating enzyme E2 14 [Morus notabilis]